MVQPFLGQIQLFAGSYAPAGWALCNRQLMSINQNQALFPLLGTTYGGDGRSTFALPNLQGRTPFHAGNGFALGQAVRCQWPVAKIAASSCGGTTSS